MQKADQNSQGLLAGSALLIDGAARQRMDSASPLTEDQTRTTSFPVCSLYDYQSRLYHSGENMKNPDTGVSTRDGRAGCGIRLTGSLCSKL